MPATTNNSQQGDFKGKIETKSDAAQQDAKEYIKDHKDANKVSADDNSN